MPEITPEPLATADPSHPRWVPPDGNRIDVGPRTPVEVEGGDVA